MNYKLYLLIIALVMIISGCTKVDPLPDQVNLPETTIISTTPTPSDEPVITDDSQPQEGYPDDESDSIFDDTQVEIEPEIVLTSEEIINQAKESLFSNDLSSLEKSNLEDEVTELIRNEFPIDSYSHNELHFYTPVNKDCHGYALLTDQPVFWCDLRENSIIEITASLSQGWYTARQIPTLSIETLTTNIIETDQVEFLIQREDLEIIYPQESMNYDTVIFSNPQDYHYMLVNDDDYKNIYFYQNPTSDSPIIGYGIQGDILRMRQNQDFQIIQTDDWIFIESNDQLRNSCHIGWIQKSQLKTIEADDQANYGYVLIDTPLYQDPSMNSDLSEHNDIFQEREITGVTVGEMVDNMYFITSGSNVRISGYINSDDLLFLITDEFLLNNVHTYFQQQLFITHLKDEIINNPDFRLLANDMDVTINLSADERNSLADALTSISSDIILWDGGLSSKREAKYPFYQLDFGDSNIVLTVDHRLLLNIDQNEFLDYGLKADMAPVRFVTPNAEFLEIIESLLPAEPNDNAEDILYMLNAQYLTFRGAYTDSDNYFQQEQINKVVRGLEALMGDVINGDVEGYDPDDTYQILFIFEDYTHVISFTDTYLYYHGIYYEVTETPSTFISNLFAAYF